MRSLLFLVLLFDTVFASSSIQEPSFPTGSSRADPSPAQGQASDGAKSPIEAVIKEIAETRFGGYGYKTANLEIVKDLCAKFNSQSPSNPYKLSVPEFEGIPSDFIIDAIDELGRVNLRQIYAECGCDPNVFETKFKPILVQIDSNQVIDLLNKRLNNKLQKFYPNDADKADIDAKKKQKIMVRSTGREDTKTMANAGGNDTIANVESNKPAIWYAIRKVLLSYFGDKSQMQQKLGADSGQKKPNLFLPVLLQVMVGETDTSGIPTSGVLFSEDPESHIVGSKKFSGIALLDFTYGHGVAVVDSLLPCDQLRIDDFGVIVPNFSKKLMRLKPNRSSNDTGLILVPNQAPYVDRPSLDKEAALTLKKFGNFLQEIYGYTVDLEWTILGNVIHIVQNRPITYDVRVMNPSYLTRTDITPTQGTKGKPIITGHKQVKRANKNNIIAEKNIMDGLKIFLDMVKKGTHTSIEFILIEQQAAATSHAATVFRGVSLPVIYMQDIKPIKSVLDGGQSILVSPQQGIVVWDQGLQESLMRDKIKEGSAGYPLEKISVDPKWLGVQETEPRLPNGSQYHSNLEIKTMQVGLLQSMQYYSTGLKTLRLDEQSPQYLLRMKALELLQQQAKLLQLTVSSENRITKSHSGIQELSKQYLRLGEYAQTEDVKRAWEEFVQAIDKQDINTRNKFNHVIAELAKYQILPFWLNSFFYNTATNKEYAKNVQLINDHLSDELDASIPYLAELPELRQTIQSWDTECFADPKTFEQKYSQFKKMLDKFEHSKLYKIFEDPITIDELRSLFSGLLGGAKDVANLIKAQTLLDAFKAKCIPIMQSTMQPWDQIKKSSKYQNELLAIQGALLQSYNDRSVSKQRENEGLLKTIEDYLAKIVELKKQNEENKEAIDSLSDQRRTHRKNRKARAKELGIDEYDDHPEMNSFFEININISKDLKAKESEIAACEETIKQQEELIEQTKSSIEHNKVYLAKKSIDDFGE